MPLGRWTLQCAPRPLRPFRTHSRLGLPLTLDTSRTSRTGRPRAHSTPSRLPSSVLPFFHSSPSSSSRSTHSHSRCAPYSVQCAVCTVQFAGQPKSNVELHTHSLTRDRCRERWLGLADALRLGPFLSAERWDWLRLPGVSQPRCRSTTVHGHKYAICHIASRRIRWPAPPPDLGPFLVPTTASLPSRSRRPLRSADLERA